MSKRLTKLQANSMWDGLRGHFTNAADAIREIIEARAWEPLGYTSFAQAWKSEMCDVTLAREIRAHGSGCERRRCDACGGAQQRAERRPRRAVCQWD